MKLVYTHPNIIVVSQARSVLEFSGIKCVLRNEYASGAIGELAPIDAWAELWVINDTDCDRAESLIEESHTSIQEAEWKCAECANLNPATFDLCWHCGGERPVHRQNGPSNS